MADSKKDSGDPSQPLREDQIVAKLKASGTPPVGLASYTGLLGRGYREGYWLLYLNLDMSRCVEMREEDIVHTEQLPPERSPFGSLGGTRVFVKKGAQVTTTTSASHTAEGDEFDLDIRLDAAQRQAAIPNTFDTECTGGECATGANQTCLTCVSCGGSCRATCFDTCRTLCDQNTCVTCNNTCDTCRTRCDQPTCQATCRTCATQCNQATCVTCQTRCNQATCVTCQTRCNQQTCRTCVTCADDTCRACTHVTCFNTCAPC
jgi:hypothetical protein